MWLPDGTLKIIDRKKNIFKLSQGEYVAPEKIENIYCQSPYIAQTFIYGDSLKPNLVAIIVPDEEVMTSWAASNGLKGTLKDWCEHKKVHKLIRDSMKSMEKRAKLAGFECAAAIHIHPEMFSVENGILTPTFKLKRPIAQKKFAKVIEELYVEADKRKKKSKL